MTLAVRSVRARAIGVSLLLVLAIGCASASVAQTRGVAVIGDSTTHGLSGGGAGPGTDLEGNREWPRLAQLNLGGRIPFYNRARDGDFTIDMIARWSHDMTPLAPKSKWAVIAGGVNDVSEGHWTVAAIEANITTLRGLATADGMIPVVATITPGSFDPTKETNRQAVNAWIRSTGDYIDFASVIEDPADPSMIRNHSDPAWHDPAEAETHYGPKGKEAVARLVAEWFSGR
jgi:lysophospholipase L1-like esterase